jgi:hypothetical protein
MAKSGMFPLQQFITTWIYRPHIVMLSCPISLLSTFADDEVQSRPQDIEADFCTTNKFDKSLCDVSILASLRTKVQSQDKSCPIGRVFPKDDRSLSTLPAVLLLTVSEPTLRIAPNFTNSPVTNEAAGPSVSELNGLLQQLDRKSRIPFRRSSKRIMHDGLRHAAAAEPAIVPNVAFKFNESIARAGIITNFVVNRSIQR